MPSLYLALTSAVFAFIAVVALLLYLHEHAQRKKLESQSDKFLDSVQEKGWETLNQSIKKSQAILGQAELESLKLTAANKLETVKLDEKFASELDDYINQSKQTIIAAQNQLLEFMSDLQKRSAEFEEASKVSGQQRINELFERVESKLADFLIQTEQKTAYSIELELRSVRQLIETYKNEQLKLIDENILAMMEQTLGLILGKKLSLKDQLDLVYESLERAKVEKFII